MYVSTHLSAGEGYPVLGARGRGGRQPNTHKGGRLRTQIICVYICIYVYICLSIYLFIYSISSTYLFINQPIHPSLHLSTLTCGCLWVWG